jgi:hypothetical protein
MTEKKQLIGIGYWHSIYESDFPDPGNFVDKEWGKEEKERILRYLKSGRSMPYTAMGVSWCRFRCGVSHLGAGEFTDGKYVWPEGLAHYIDKHEVRLPTDVVAFMLSNKNPVVVSGDDIFIDWTWWKKQKGFNTAITTFNDPLDIGILSIIQNNSIQKLKQGDLLRKYLLDSYGVKGRLHAIEKILMGEEVRIKGRFKNVDDFISDIRLVGLHGKFDRLTIEDYGKD